MTEMPMPPDELLESVRLSFLDAEVVVGRFSGEERDSLRPLWEWGYKQGVANAEAQAQAAADAELEACCEWTRSQFHGHQTWPDELRAARRPKPLSRRQQALDRTRALLDNPSYALLDSVREVLALNLMALEAIPEDES